MYMFRPVGVAAMPALATITRDFSRLVTLDFVPPMPPKKGRKGAQKKPGNPSGQCSTLLEDEVTRCSEIPTHGNPVERCRVHHGQYQTMTKKYKEAQKFVDETLAGALIPSKEDVLGYTSVPAILEKARLLKRYVNAIRDERTGREIHHNRFFMKGMSSVCTTIPSALNCRQVDDGHKIRIKILAKQMSEGVEIRDALEAQALRLHIKDHPAKDWIEEFQATPLDDAEDGAEEPRIDMFALLRSTQEQLKQQTSLNPDDDLIGLRSRL
jgi:hypothetical protein